MYTHLGWRKHGGDWIYLQADGAIAAKTVADVQVQRPASLQHFQTRIPADGQTVRKAVRSSLDFLSVAPNRISLPLLAAVYRAPFGSVDFSLFLSGRSGVFKSTIAALCQQHFGAAMDPGHLPGNFASTANALEELAFLAKDTLLVVDDELERRSRQALKEAAAIQYSYQQVSDPALLFMSLLRSALLCGQAHVAERRGSTPEFPERWGWRQKADGVWVAQGTESAGSSETMCISNLLSAVKSPARWQAQSNSQSARIRCRGDCSSEVCW